MKKLYEKLKQVIKPGMTFKRYQYSDDELTKLSSIKCQITSKDRIFTKTCETCRIEITDPKSFRCGELCCQVTCDGDGSCPYCDDCPKRVTYSEVVLKRMEN